MLVCQLCGYFNAVCESLFVWIVQLRTGRCLLNNATFYWRLFCVGDKLLLTVTRMALALSAKAFSVSAPSVWNSLSYNCTSAELIGTFKRSLKRNCLVLLEVTVNTQPSLCHYAPQIHSWHVALRECVLVDWVLIRGAIQSLHNATVFLTYLFVCRISELCYNHGLYMTDLFTAIGVIFLTENFVIPRGHPQCDVIYWCDAKNMWLCCGSDTRLLENLNGKSYVIVGTVRQYFVNGAR